MKKNHTAQKSRDVLVLTTEAIRSAEKFLESDTPAATATKVVLALTALSPIVVTGAVAPNVVQLLMPYSDGRRRAFSTRQTSSALNHLHRSKYLSIRRFPDESAEIRITKKGMKQARKLCLETVKLSCVPVWDMKWHLLFYDIPVRFNRARMAFRDMVDNLGMFPLQKSVWVYPYACEAEILFIADFFGVARYVNFAVADSLFDEVRILNFFGLKK